ncbi:MAG: hypothetical protein E7180_06450 [Erysipelotrichaceae bacterium]|nr:hypothetical protein [Erysipelotrichaceae bacterium]
MFLVNFEFTINFGSLAAFLTGILCGVILFILIYFLYVMLYLNKKEINLHSNSDIVTEDDIKKEIKKSQDKFLELKKSYGVITIDSLKDVTVELISNIAKLYYPDSKQPIAELTIKELILLDKYLIEKIDTLLNGIGFKFVKKIRLKRFLSILNMKQNLDKSNVVKATKKVGKFTSGVLFVLNFINPYKWIHLGVIKPTMNVIVNKICLLCISYVGEETCHIYSKQAFLDPVLDEDIEKLIQVIEEDSEEEVKETKKTKRTKVKL